MRLAKQFGSAISLPFLSVFLSVLFHHSLEEKSYKTLSSSGRVTRFEYRAPLLVPRNGVKSTIDNAPQSTGERVLVQTRSMEEKVKEATAPRTVSFFVAPPVLASHLVRHESALTQEQLLPKTVLASWYGSDFHGRTMADNKPFNMNDPTIVAHKELPLGTQIRTTNLANGRSIVVVVQDRGPYVNGRELDFSYAAARRLGFAHQGIARVHMRILSSAGQGAHE